MPTVLRVGPYRFVFYAIDRTEPPHVHVKSGPARAKLWLEPGVVVASSRGFAEHELNVIEKLVVQYRQLLLEKWHEFFNGQ